MTTKELLQQALDALLPHSSSHGNSWRAVEDAAIDALKQAIAQEQEPLFKVLIDKHPGLADELASQSANTNLVVSQKLSETRDNRHQSRFFDL